ncbi:MAG: MFS transporter [Sedimentisphaerales bacterium]
MIENKDPCQTPNLIAETPNNSQNQFVIKIMLFAFMLALYFISYFHRISVPGTIFNELQRDFNATATNISMLGAIFLYIYAIMQIFTGILVDRVGPARIMILAGIILAVGAILFSFATSLNMLYATRALLACGASVIYLCLVKEIAELFSSKNFAVFLGIALVAGYLGGVAGTYPFERAVNFIGWRKSILTVGIITAVFIAGFILLYLRIKDKKSSFVKISFENVTSVVANIFTFPIYVSNCITFAIGFLIQSSIGKKILEDCFDFNTKKAASYILVLAALSMTGAGISGFVSKLIKNKRKPLIIFGSSMSLAFCILMLLAVKGLVGRYILLPAFIISGLSSIALPIGAACIKELNDRHISATAISFLNAATYGAIAILVTATGYIMDLFGNMTVKKGDAIIYPKEAYMAIFTLCLVLSIFSLFGAMLVKETQGVCLEN